MYSLIMRWKPDQTLSILESKLSKDTGGFIGDHHGTKAFIQKKIMEWANSIVKLSNVAESQPQADFAALVKSSHMNGEHGSPQPS